MSFAAEFVNDFYQILHIFIRRFRQNTVTQIKYMTWSAAHLFEYVFRAPSYFVFVSKEYYRV